MYDMLKEQTDLIKELNNLHRAKGEKKKEEEEKKTKPQADRPNMREQVWEN